MPSLAADPTALPVRLLGSPERPNGRRYSQDEKDAAFELWRTTGGRSLRAVAEATSIAASTLGTWHQRDDWPGRAKRADQDARKSVRLSIGSVVTREILKSIQTAITLRDDALGKTPAKVRLEAAQWIAGVGGVAPVKVVENLTRPADDEPATLTREAASALSQEERTRRKREYEEAYAAKARGEAPHPASA